MPKVIRNTARKLFLPLAGWLCLCAYVAFGAQLLPGVVTLALALDDDHRIIALADGDRVELIVHHEESHDEAADDHEHGEGLPELLLMLVAGAESRHGDHVVHLAKPGKQAAASAVVAVAKPMEVSMPTETGLLLGVAQPAMKTVAGTGARPPPRRAAISFARRSTSLVI